MERSRKRLGLLQPVVTSPESSGNFYLPIVAGIISTSSTIRYSVTPPSISYSTPDLQRDTTMNGVSNEHDVLDVNEIAVATSEESPDPEPVDTFELDEMEIKFIEKMGPISNPVSNRAEVEIEITRTTSGSFSAVFHTPYGFCERLSGINTIRLTLEGRGTEQAAVTRRKRKSNIGPESISFSLS